MVFAHIPLWTVYAEWGWGTDDAAQALKLLARFGSVTVLNGHIHQITQKVEGKIAFHTARSTAFPQPAPGTAPSPGPLKVPAEQLHSMLGITDALFVRGHDRIALIDSTLRLTKGPNMTRAFKILALQAAALASSAVLLSTVSVVTRAAPAPPAAAVAIDNFTFKNPVVTVKPGTTVTWTNGDDIPHTVVSKDRRVQIEGARYRRQILLHLRQAGPVRLFLFPAPAHDGHDHRQGVRQGLAVSS